MLTGGGVQREPPRSLHKHIQHKATTNGKPDYRQKNQELFYTNYNPIL